MTSVDGVILGNTYNNILGVNVNRDWKEPDPYKNPVIFELKKYLKRLDAKRQMQLFFFLDIKTIMTKAHTFVETNEYPLEDAFDRFLKIRFFPHVLHKINPVFNKDLTIFYPKLKNLEASFSVIKNEFNTFMAYQLNLNPVLERLRSYPN